MLLGSTISWIGLVHGVGVRIDLVYGVGLRMDLGGWSATWLCMLDLAVDQPHILA